MPEILVMNISLVFEIIFFACLLCGGGVGCSIFTDLMNKTVVDGVHFRRPWFQTLLVFISFTLAFIPLWIRLLFLFWRKSQKSKLDGMEKADVNKKGVFKVAILALCNLLSKVISNIGLFWLPVSIFQALRGSALIFSVVLTVVYRKRKLPGHAIIGIAFVSVPLVLMGMQAMLQNKPGQETTTFSASSTWHVLLGIVFVVGSQAIEALKIILMEVYLNDLNMGSFSILAWQGVWGMLVCSLVILPICSYLPGGMEGDGIHEHILMSLGEVFRSPRLMAYSVGIIVSILCCNTGVAYLIKISNGLTHTVLEQFRGVLVWVISLVLHLMSGGKSGEPWTKWSFVQLGGFLLLIFGTLVYSGAFVARSVAVVVAVEKSGDDGCSMKGQNEQRGKGTDEGKEGGEEERGVKSPELQLQRNVRVWEPDGKEEKKVKLV